MKLPLLVVRHHFEENLGALERIFIERGIPFTYRDVFRYEMLPGRLNAYSGFIVLGGFMGVYEQEEYPFLKDELNWLTGVLDAGKPVLGICLGSQLVASALGARVFRGEAGPEIGWKPVHLTEEGKADPVFKNVPEAFVPIHWHGDTFDLPAGAKMLASSEMYPHQAFRYGENAYGFQFHFEANQKLIDYWMKTDPETMEKAGVSAEPLQADTAKYLPALENLAEQIWQNLEPIFFEE